MSTTTLNLRERARLTFRYDLVRGACQGILETGFQTIALIILVRHFQASPLEKGLVAGANAYGLLLTPLFLHYFYRFGWAPAKLASNYFLFAGVVIAVLVFVDQQLVFVIAILLSSILLTQHLPPMVQIYAENYERRKRGSMLSNSLVLSVLVAAFFSALAGKLLDQNLGAYPLIFLCMVGASLLSAWAIRRIPSTAAPVLAQPRNPFHHLSLAWQDRTFGGMLLIWMFMGIGNLMVLPLRVEYMANPLYGVDATNSQIALMTVILPSMGRLATTHWWGYVFDRYNFAVVRAILNSLFLISILLFFFTTNFWVMLTASLIFGMAVGGGNIAWNLWVTKVAPEEKTAAYMSVHTFFTGIRGIAAPFAGFALLTVLSPQVVSLIAALFIAVSIGGLVPLGRKFSPPPENKA